MEGVAPKHQQTLDRMKGVAEPVRKEEEVKEEDEVMRVVDMTEL